MRLLTLLFCISFFSFSNAQEVNTLLKEAGNFERIQKEKEALAKYTEVLKMDSTNSKAFLKSIELLVAASYREDDKKIKKSIAENATLLATKYWFIDSLSADVYYVKALSDYCLSKTDIDNKLKFELLRNTYTEILKSLKMNPNHNRANYVFGKWHFDIENQSDVKRVSKLLYGGLPKSDIDTAIFYMEKCKTIDQYYIQNYVELAKAYQFINRPAQATELLNKILRLPVRTADDEKWKAEAKKLLDQ